MNVATLRHLLMAAALGMLPLLSACSNAIPEVSNLGSSLSPVRITSPTEGTAFNSLGSQFVTGVCLDGAPVEVSGAGNDPASLPNSAACVAGTFSLWITLDGSVDGVKSITVSQTDPTSLATASSTTNYLFDTTAPASISITSAPADPSGANVGFAFNSTDAGTGVGHFSCTLDGAPIDPCSALDSNSGSISYNGLSVGTHTFIVASWDKLGNGPASTGYTWNVSAPDQAPILTTIVGQAVAENVAITQVNADDGGDDLDADGDTITYQCWYDTAINGAVAATTSCAALTGVAFDSNTGVMNWTPNYSQAGGYEFMIVASEGDLSDSEIFAISVSNVDRAPLITAIADQTVAENVPITGINADDDSDDFDIDGDALTYECWYDQTNDGAVAETTQCATLSGVAFSSISGTMTWTPNYFQSGTYEFIIKAREDDLSDTEIFLITVSNVDRPPVIAVISDQTVFENAAIASVNANDGGDDFDADNDAITYQCWYDTVVNGSVSETTLCGALTGVTFNTTTGTLNWTPNFTQAGVYEFLIKGSEDDLSGTEIFAITVNNMNQAPVLDLINDETVLENTPITLVNANDGSDDLDADGEAITYQCWYDMNPNAAVSESVLCTALIGLSFNSTTGVMNWTPGIGDAGQYEILIKGSDGSLTDTEIFVITVQGSDQAPQLAAISDISVNENSAIPTIDANDAGDDLDADGDTITYQCWYDTTINGAVAETTLCTALTGVSFNTTTGVMDWTPDYSQSGSFEFIIKGDEGDLSDTEIFAITVTNTDQAPVLAAIGDETVAESFPITQVNADDDFDDFDIDGDAITYQCWYDTAINGAVAETTLCTALSSVSFNTTTGVMDWTPDYSQAGTYEFIIKGSEGDLTDTEIFAITVTNTDRAPVLAAIGDETVAENVAITQVNANDGGDDDDADGDTITYQCWYDTVINGAVAETTLCTALTGVSFNTTTGVMDWTPDYTQSGTYEFIIKSDEGDLTDTEIFAVTVTNTDRAPVLADINDETVAEGVAITQVNANDGGDDQDADGDTITYQCWYDTTVNGAVAETTLCTALTGLSFNTTTGVMNWTPGIGDAGQYEILIKGSDGSLTDTEIFVITVQGSDQAPQLAAISDISVNENSAIPTIDANDAGDDLDADGDVITYQCWYDTSVDSSVLEVALCSSLAGVSFNSTTGIMNWTPDYTQSGLYEFAIKGSEDNLSDTELFTITVSQTDRAPVLAAIGNQSISEGAALAQVNANDGGDDFDVDGDTITYQCWYDNTIDASVAESTLCSSLAALSFNSATGILNWTPTYTQAGSYEFKIKGDANSLTDFQIFTVTVSGTNQPPSLATIADATVNEDSPIAQIDANDGGDDFDIDGESITYQCWYDNSDDGVVAPTVPCASIGASFNSATGIMNWTPDYSQEGTYEFAIIGSDGSGGDDTEIFKIAVSNTNRAPFLAAISGQTVIENMAIASINANDGGDDIDSDGETISYQCWYDTTVNGSVDANSCSALGVIFNTSTGLMDWTPGFTSAGVYEFKIVGSDGSATGDAIFVITVTDIAPFTWTGADWATNSNWSNVANWSSKPGPSDTAIFNNSCSGSACNVTVDEAVNIAGLQLEASYTGEIVLGAFNFNVSNDINIDGGSFSAGTGSISVRDLTYNNGTFKSLSSAIIYVEGDYTAGASAVTNWGSSATLSTIRFQSTTPVSISIANGSNFENVEIDTSSSISGANIIATGDVTIDSCASITASILLQTSSVQTLNQGGSCALSDLEINAIGVVTLTGTIQIAANYTFISALGGFNVGSSTIELVGTMAAAINPGSGIFYNDVLINKSAGSAVNLTNNWEISGDLILTGNGSLSGSDMNVSGDGISSGTYTGSSDIRMVGTASQSVSGTFPNIEIAKPSGTLSYGGPLNILRNFTYTSGAVSVGANITAFGSVASGTISSSAAFNIGDVFINKGSVAGVSFVGQVKVNDLTINGSSNNILQAGTVYVYGDLTHTAGSGGSAIIEMAGSAVQSVSGSQLYWPLTVNKTGGHLTLATGLGMNSNNVTLTSASASVVKQGAAHAWTGIGTLHLGAGTKWIQNCSTLGYSALTGTGTLISGDEVSLAISSAGTVAEGNDAIFTVTSTPANCEPTVFTWNTVDGTALQPGVGSPGTELEFAL